jgi:cytosine/uracil/thiamine/allantoin permease
VVNWWLISIAGFILLFAAIFLWIWVMLRRSGRQEVKQAMQKQEEETKKKTRKE